MPPIPIGVARLTQMLYRGSDLRPLADHLVERATADSGDAAALMDLATIYQLYGNREDGLSLQASALAVDKLYHQPAHAGKDAGIRLLAIMAPGDMMANIPIQFLVQGTDVALDLLYILPGESLPETVPDHDLAMVCIGESDENNPTLEALIPLLDRWPKPILDHPRRLLRLRRDRFSDLLQDIPGTCVPRTVRLGREEAEKLGRGDRALGALPPDGDFPIILRPIGSHAGHGLAKLDSVQAVSDYLWKQPAEEFYLSEFIDYSRPDGQFVKYRVALLDGRPFVCHAALSSHWMVHYLNAGMEESAEKRAEEARIFATFDETFARRHRVALAALTERLGLEYYVIDCGETRDGELLLFEADTAVIVHSMDSPELFPYKAPQMNRVFQAFRSMLLTFAGKEE